MEIFEYTDYRKYLKDFYLLQKANKSSYSYRVFATHAKLSSPNYLKLVIDGQRRITDRLSHQFVRGLALNPHQARYFKNLILYQESEDIEAKEIYLKEMIKLRRRNLQNLGGPQEVAKDRDEILSHWYHWAIRELVLLDDFKPESEWIADRLGQKITPKQAKESLELLKRLEFISQKNGKTILSQSLISTTDEVSSLLIRNLHRQFMELGAQSILSDPLESREVNGLTIALPKSRVPDLKKAIKNFRKTINRLYSTDQGNEEIYHLIINLFPLTQPGKKS